MDILKRIGKKILPQAVIYFYHSVRISRKMGSLGPLLRTLPNVTRKVRLGGEAGWTIPKDALNSSSLCYCIGCGEDISFDLELMRRYSCQVFAFDPTPRAIAYVKAHASHLPDYNFSEVAVWSDEGVVRFYVPGEELGVSHSITNLDGTSEYIEVPSKRLKQILAENGHGAIALLKMDIEGAEHTVIKTIIDDGLQIDVLCVEFDELENYATPERVAAIKATIGNLLEFGYSYFWIEGSNITFVRNPAAETRATRVGTHGT